MLRSLTVVLMLLLGPALPAAAQKADSKNPSRLCANPSRPSAASGKPQSPSRDSRAVAALFTADGTFVTPAGVLPDRQAIKTFYEGFFKQGWNNEVGVQSCQSERQRGHLAEVRWYCDGG